MISSMLTTTGNFLSSPETPVTTQLTDLENRFSVFCQEKPGCDYKKHAKRRTELIDDCVKLARDCLKKMEELRTQPKNDKLQINRSMLLGLQCVQVELIFMSLRYGE